MEHPDWEKAIRAEWKTQCVKWQRPAGHPLVARTFDEDEVVEMIKVVLSGQLTMSSRVREFEHRFAQYDCGSNGPPIYLFCRVLGVPHAVMVNSGSSANLLALSALANAAVIDGVTPGDEVLVPAVCWSTSLWPIVQNGLKPVFVDVDPCTLNVDIADLKRKLTARSRAIVLVHVLGMCCPMDDLMAIAAEHRLTVVEDTCESFGSRYDGRCLGTFGRFGCFSFYYSVRRWVSFIYISSCKYAV